MAKNIYVGNLSWECTQDDLLALFQQHGEAITWAGYVTNLIPVTLGNLVGGAVFVGGAYWLAARSASFGPTAATRKR